MRSKTVPRTDAAGTVWLCRPGIKDNPCTGNLDATSITGTNKRTVQTASATGSKKYDCFYIYPTASNETTVNSNLVVQPAEELIAMAQAARFSQVCDVWAPMYRQITVAGLHSASGGGTDPGTIAYDSVLSDWKDFIAHYDDGHPIIFIGHSQGSVMMIKLLQAEVDPNATVRKLVVAAIIAGGNVTVPTGKTVGSTFQHLPLCTSSHQSGCVIAYSSFPSEPPSDSMFGRPGQGISLNWGQTATTGVQVACVNPADIGGGYRRHVALLPDRPGNTHALRGPTTSRRHYAVGHLSAVVHIQVRERRWGDLAPGDRHRRQGRQRDQLCPK